MKKFVTIIVILVVILIGLTAYNFTKNKEDGGTVITTGTGTSTTATIETKTITDKSDEYKYVINVEYPQIKDIDATIAAKINKELEVFALHSSAELKESNFIREIPEALKASEEKSFLEVKYKIADTLENNLLSVHFSSLFYIVGAAHPGKTTTTHTFDIRTGEKIDLESLFKGDYLNTLSDIAIPMLRNKLGENTTQELLQEGAGPLSKNFKSFFITKTGIVFIFDQYQVASYAAGTQEILIGYDRLKEVIKQEGALQQFVQ